MKLAIAAVVLTCAGSLATLSRSPWGTSSTPAMAAVLPTQLLGSQPPPSAPKAFFADACTKCDRLPSSVPDPLPVQAVNCKIEMRVVRSNFDNSDCRTSTANCDTKTCEFDLAIQGRHAASGCSNATYKVNGQPFNLTSGWTDLVTPPFDSNSPVGCNESEQKVTVTLTVTEGMTSKTITVDFDAGCSDCILVE